MYLSYVQAEKEKGNSPLGHSQQNPISPKEEDINCWDTHQPGVEPTVYIDLDDLDKCVYVLTTSTVDYIEIFGWWDFNPGQGTYDP